MTQIIRIGLLKEIVKYDKSLLNKLVDYDWFSYPLILFKHAIGTIEEIVVSAIEKNIKYLTITDHAPFLIDKNNRLVRLWIKILFWRYKYCSIKIFKRYHYT